MKNIDKITLSIFASAIALSAQAQMNPKLKFDEALKVIQENYVDEVKDEQLVDAAIKAMVGDLDPHSAYISREEAEAMNQVMSGSFAGIGIKFLKVNDSTIVTGVNPDGPAARGGLRQGDRIIAVDGKTVIGKGLKNQDIMLLLRGEKGKAVKLDVTREGVEKTMVFNIMREQIAELSILASYMVDKEVGYIALSIFGESTRREMDAALKKLKAEGMKKLILDLQNNGGGYVEAAIGVADEFLPKESEVFYSVNNKGNKDYYGTGGFGQFMSGNLVVLIDESTASSSEIVTGALQDHDRAVIVGRRSFGKGLMQKSLVLTDGSVLRITGARYYTPSGRSIQKSYEKGKADYFGDFNRRMASGELKEEGHFQWPDSLKYKTLVNKRTVYGGGGIMPDKFIPIDTNVYSVWLGNVMNSGVLTRTGFNYVQQNRAALMKKYPEFPAFNAAFKSDDFLIDEVLTQAAAKIKGIPAKTDAGARKSIAVELKSEIAALLYIGNSFPLRVRNEDSESFHTALNILRDETMYKKLLSGTIKTTTTKNSK